LHLAARKGAPLHTHAGTLFAVSLLVVGVSGFISALLKPTLDIPLTASGVIASYLVATSWVAARRRSGRTGRFEVVACIAVLTLAAGFGACGIAALLAPDRLFKDFGPQLYGLFAAICLYMGCLDLALVRRGRMSGRQRLERHLWRMCLAYLVLTSFLFLGRRIFCRPCCEARRLLSCRRWRRSPSSSSRSCAFDICRFRSPGSGGSLGVGSFPGRKRPVC
jgi:hypothetical protein